jgi:DNA-binding transcriptional LysR family regulator
MVGYPEGGVLGGVLRDEILPRSSSTFTLVASTEFSSAVLELCEHGLGIGWAPELLAAEKLRNGQLRLLNDPEAFPSVVMNLSMLRVRDAAAGFANTAWNELMAIFGSQ